jgi:hypothetical protein
MSTTSEAQRRRERLAEKQDGICPACLLPLPEDLAGTEVDHIIPRCRGGPNLKWNRRLLHFTCNRSKRAKLTDEAVALAAEYGVMLREPPKPRSRYWWQNLPGVSLRQYLDETSAERLSGAPRITDPR